MRHEIRGHTAFITLDNPPANTWTPESLRDMEALVGQLEDDRNVYAAILTGAGEKFFSAGADLDRFRGDKAAAREFITLFGSAFGALMDSRLVTIAAVNGYAMGGGLECALACDIRIAEEHAQMALPEPAVGLLPGGCGTQNLPWLVGEGWAKRMILTNERVDAATALRIGLVEEVVPKGAGSWRPRRRWPSASRRSPARRRLLQGTRPQRAQRRRAPRRASCSSASSSSSSSTTATRPRASTPSSRSASPNGRTTEGPNALKLVTYLHPALRPPAPGSCSTASASWTSGGLARRSTARARCIRAAPDAREACASCAQVRRATTSRSPT
jgi:enoyl-CoA hydratase/carnithine racemase